MAENSSCSIRITEKAVSKGVRLDEAYDYSKCNRDSTVIKTMNKLSIYIKHVEREYGITILKQTEKRNQTLRYRERLCA